MVKKIDCPRDKEVPARWRVAASMMNKLFFHQIF